MSALRISQWILITMVPCVIEGCIAAPNPAAEHEGRSTSKSEVIDAIQSLPSWQQHTYGEAEVEQLNAVIDLLSDVSTAEIEDAITHLYSASGSPVGDFDRDGKCFLALRGLFALPSSTPAHIAKVFGGWVRPDLNTSAPPTTYNLLWPLTMDETGTKVASVAPFRGYFGASYDAPSELRWFQGTYGRRQGVALSQPQ